VGHKGAACGIAIGGALALSLAGSDTAGEGGDIASRNCARVGLFLDEFERRAGGVLCREISGIDFDNEWHVRKYILAGSLDCIRLAARSSKVLADAVADEGGQNIERYHDLNAGFSEKNFHCAYYSLARASELLSVEPVLTPRELIPLNGGIAYSGSTCTALLGGCLAIGAKTGGESGDNSIPKTLYRMMLTLFQGGAAFNRLDLSPANDALLRCGKLFDWFEQNFHTHMCREVIGIDFGDADHVRRYFERDIISECKSMAEKTAEKAAELAR
jgi:hypothetical protein